MSGTTLAADLPMNAVRIFAVSLNQTPLDWPGNRDRIVAALSAARDQGAELVCLPELCLSGYGCEDAFLWPATAEQCLLVLEQVLPATQGMVVALGLPLRVSGQLFNASVLVCDGQIVGAACKRHLALAGIHYEPRWFVPWPRGRVEEVSLLGKNVPVGDLVFELDGLRLAFEICEDAWVEERPALELAHQEVDIILNPSASHFAFDKHLVRRKLVLDGVKATRLAYVYCNLLGNEAGRAIYDGDCLIAAADDSPQIVAESRRFSFCDFQLAGATLTRRNKPSLAAPFPSSDARQTVHHAFQFASAAELPVVSSKTPGEDSAGTLPREQAFARAVALGLFDYLRKSRAQGYVVSLSGGADSAAVALLVRLMVRLCWQERGAEQAQHVLLPKRKETVASEEELVGRLLTTVYQATENSSSTTRNAARAVAQALCADHHEVSVDDVVHAYCTKVEGLLGRKLSWEQDDVSLQNIQARARAPLVWMLANVRGALLLSTSNRSEAAVGYATMDGDTAGGLCPIAGIDKAFLRRWLLFMQHTGLVEFGPLPALSLINQQQPTAELRPSEFEQTDESDLMPYEVLDVIERAAFYQRKSPALVLELVVERFACERSLALDWLTRFFRLFASNQWKRERYAPSFYLDEGNLDPKTWLRFPILSGGFAQELAALSLQEAQSAQETQSAQESNL